jgi:hypothetical protein
MTTELKLRDAPGIALTDAILTVLRLIVAESDPRLRATLAQTLDAMSHSYGGKGATLRFETGSQALCWAAQLLSDLDYSSHPDRWNDPRPVVRLDEKSGQLVRLVEEPPAGHA